MTKPSASIRALLMPYAARGEALWTRYGDARSPEDAQAAIEANNAALRLEPNRAEVRLALAVTLAGTGQPDTAIEELHRALALRPNFEDARIQLGRVLARQGKTDEAIAEFRKVSDQRPNFVAPYSAMGSSLYEAGRYREAAAAFERVTVLQPDNVIAYQQVGVAYQSLGDNDRALAFYQKALAIRPYPQAYSNIGAIYHERGEYAKAGRCVSAGHRASAQCAGDASQPRRRAGADGPRSRGDHGVPPGHPAGRRRLEGQPARCEDCRLAGGVLTEGG